MVQLLSDFDINIKKKIMDFIKDLGELFKKVDPKDVKIISGVICIAAIVKFGVENVVTAIKA